jgi:hypothetical protein
LPHPGEFPTLRITCADRMAPRSLQWVNSPVLMEALDRYEQGRLPHSMRLWVEAVLELERPLRTPLRPHC